MEFKREDTRITTNEDGRKIREQVITSLSYEQTLELAIRKFNAEYSKAVIEQNEATKEVKAIEIQLQEIEKKLQTARQKEADKKAVVQSMNGKKESFCTRLGVINK